jgi:hypothetical protein
MHYEANNKIKKNPDSGTTGPQTPRAVLPSVPGGHEEAETCFGGVAESFHEASMAAQGKGIG